MRYVKLAWIAIFTMSIVSAAFNFIYGWRLGEHSFTVTTFFHDGWIYGFLSIASDGMKLCLGVLTIQIIIASHLHWCWRAGGALLSAMLFCGATLYSLNSAAGSIATNRMDSVGLREAKALGYDALATQLKSVQDRQAWIGEHRPADSIAIELTYMRQDPLWGEKRSLACTNATTPDSVAFCGRYASLDVEHANALDAVRLAGEAKVLRAKLERLGGKVVADPHAAFLSGVTGYDSKLVVQFWLILISVLVEAASTFGPIVLYIGRLAMTAPSKDPAAAVVRDSEYEDEPDNPVVVRLVPRVSVPTVSTPALTRVARGPVKVWKDHYMIQTDKAGYETMTDVLWHHYVGWCKGRGYVPLDKPPFGKALTQLGVKRRKTKIGASRPGWKLKGNQLQMTGT